jgi:RNA polymerase sigma-70 factor, ECF subfamily
MSMSRETLLRQFIAQRTSLLGYLRVLMPVDLAEDAYQETFLVVESKLGVFDDTRDFGAWVRGIARKVASRVAAKHQRSRTLADDRLADRIDQAWLEAEESSDPLAAKLPALRTCLEHLPEAQRSLLQQRYHEGRSIEALASATGRKASAVQVALSRLRAALHECVMRGGRVGHE